jgi:Ca-activated chloride channel family protein
MNFMWFDLLAALLIVPILIGVYIWSLGHRRPAGVRYSSLSLVRGAVRGTSRIRRHLPFALFAAAIAALVLAMARPVVVVAVPTNETTIILTIDVSGSMCSSDIPPSRLEAAEAAAAKFINNQAASTRIGIVAFSSYAEVVQAPTNDKTALLSALQSLATGRRTASATASSPRSTPFRRVDPTVAKSQSDTSTGTPPGAGGQRATTRPTSSSLLTDGAKQQRHDPIDAAAAGGRSGRAGLHDRLRHGERRDR